MGRVKDMVIDMLNESIIESVKLHKNNNGKYDLLITLDDEETEEELAEEYTINISTRTLS